MRTVLPFLRLPLLGLPLLALSACTGKDGTPNVFDTNDTGPAECGRVRGADGVMMWDADATTTVYYPVDEPSSVATTGVAGPIGADALFLAAREDGRVLSSLDTGCNWDTAGSLPAGTWRLTAAGDRAYAWDLSGGSAARSDDGGGSWSPFTPGGAFVSPPQVSDRDATWIRGLLASGVVTSTDGGDTWNASGGALPGDLGELRSVAFSGDDLDRVVLATATGVWASTSGGTSWNDVTAGMLKPLNTTTIGGHAVAMSADDSDILAAIVEEDDGVFGLVRSTDGGQTWVRLADSTGIGLSATSGLWIAPGRSTEVLTTYTDAGAEFPLHLNVSTQESGTGIVKTAIYDAVQQMAFSPGPEGRYLGAVTPAP